MLRILENWRIRCPALGLRRSYSMSSRYCYEDRSAALFLHRILGTYLNIHCVLTNLAKHSAGHKRLVHLQQIIPNTVGENPLVRRDLCHFNSTISVRLIVSE